jgi:hypothetical protein
MLVLRWHKRLADCCSVLAGTKQVLAVSCALRDTDLEFSKY